MFFDLFGKNLTNPNFLIIGSQKGGTTSLFQYLSQHPNFAPIKLPWRKRNRPFSDKELHFFNQPKKYKKGLRWYKRHFPRKHEAEELSAELNSKIIAGEATPLYLDNPLAPERINANLPNNTKFIALLRNPVHRAYSQYKMELKRGDEHLSFEEAIKQEESRLSKEPDGQGNSSFHHAYLKRGLYAEQLKRWYSFYPKENIMVVKSEDFFSHPKEIYHQTCEFLEIPQFELKEYKTANKGNDSSYKDLKPETKEFLKEYFEPHNQELYSLIGQDYNWYNEA